VTPSVDSKVKQVGQALVESVISVTTVILALIGVVHLIALAWWAIAVPLVNAEVQRLVLKQLSLVQLVTDPPELGLLTDASQFGVSSDDLSRSARWLLPAAPKTWHSDELASGRLQLRCMVLKDRDGFLKLGCRTDWKSPFGWELERSDWISQRPGGTVERFEGNFLKQG
jgi:hypothetical protein